MVVWLSGHASLPAGFSTFWACIRAVRARLPAPVHFFPPVSLARAHTMRITIRVSTQTHTLVRALRVLKTSSWLFTIRPKPTYYHLVVDGAQRLPERPADVCQRLDLSWYLCVWTPARPPAPTSVRKPSSPPRSRSKRLGTARGIADCKGRATRDSHLE